MKRTALPGAVGKGVQQHAPLMQVQYVLPHGVQRSQQARCGAMKGGGRGWKLTFQPSNGTHLVRSCLQCEALVAGKRHNSSVGVNASGCACAAGAAFTLAAQNTYGFRRLELPFSSTSTPRARTWATTRWALPKSTPTMLLMVLLVCGDLEPAGSSALGERGGTFRARWPVAFRVETLWN